MKGVAIGAIALIIIAIIVIALIVNDDTKHAADTKQTAEPMVSPIIASSSIAKQVSTREYSLDSVDLYGKTMGYIRIRPRETDVMILLRVPNQKDYSFALNPIFSSNEGGGNSSNHNTDTSDTHIEKEAYASTETFATSNFGGRTGWYPHAAGYSMNKVSSNSAIPSATQQELPVNPADIPISGPTLLLEGFDWRAGEGYLMITERDGQLHIYSTILSKLLIDIERKKMPHYHFTLRDITTL